MAPMYLAALQAACSILLSILMYRPPPSRNHRTWTLFALFWAAHGLYHVAAAVCFLQVSAGLAAALPARVAGAAAVIVGPSFLAAAAWKAGHAVRHKRANVVALLAVAVTFAGYAGNAMRSPSGTYPVSAAVPLLATAVALFWFGFERVLRRRARAWLDPLLSAYALHLAAVGLSLLGAPIYTRPFAAPSAAVGATLLFGLALSRAGASVLDLSVLHRRLAAIWAASSDGIRITDEAGVILCANRAYGTMVGRRAETLRGCRFTDSFHTDLREPLLREHQEQVRRPGNDCRKEQRLRLSDERTVWLETSGSVLAEPGRVCVLTTVRDLTEQKRSQDAFDRSVRQEEMWVRVCRRIHECSHPADIMAAVAGSAVELTGAAQAHWSLLIDGELRSGEGAAASDLCRRAQAELRPVFDGGDAQESPPRAAFPLIGGSGRLLACIELVGSPGIPGAHAAVLDALAVIGSAALEHAGAMAEQRSAIRALADSEQHYRGIVEAAPVGVHWHTLTADGQLIFSGSNPAADTVLRLEHRPLYGKPIEEAFPGWEPAVAASYRRTALGGDSWSIVHYQRREEVVAAICEVHAFRVRPGAVAAIFHDITAQRRAEEALQASEARYRLLTENAADTISTHARDGTFTFVSLAVRSLSGHEPGELAGVPVQSLIHPDDRPALRRLLRTLLRDGKARHFGCRLGHKNGSWVWVESSIRPLRGEADSGYASFLCVTRDITRRREFEDHLHRSKMLETVGRLAGGVAHDFNNLLTVVNGYASMLAETLDDSDPAHSGVLEIAAAGTRAAVLTQQLLAFSSRQILEVRVLDLNTAIREAESILRRLSGDDVDFRLQLDPEAARVRADSGQIRQLLLHLVLNARDAMPQGGSILIATHREAARGESPGTHGGSRVVLSVTDSGCGMDEETRSHLFEPFFSTKTAGQHGGLGLSTVFGIVHQGGGFIRVESAPGRGTSFHIDFPEADEAVAKPEASAGLDTTRGSETILVVEDQPEVRGWLTRTLTADGYRVLDAADGDEALAVSERHAGPIHLTVSDVIMPGMNGRELADRLVALRPSMKVLFVSGYPHASIAGRIGPDADYLQKPFPPAALTNRVRRALGDRRNRSILLVDDEASVRGLLRKVLESAGFNVVEAANGSEAISRVRQNPIDLILTDLVMPEKEGLDVIRELRRFHRSLPIVAMSGALGGRYLKSAAMLGAQATIKKPIAPDELLRTLERLMGS